MGQAASEIFESTGLASFQDSSSEAEPHEDATDEAARFSFHSVSQPSSLSGH